MVRIGCSSRGHQVLLQYTHSTSQLCNNPVLPVLGDLLPFSGHQAYMGHTDIYVSKILIHKKIKVVEKPGAVVHAFNLNLGKQRQADL